jgi:hypothetical protein
MTTSPTIFEMYGNLYDSANAGGIWGLITPSSTSPSDKYALVIEGNAATSVYISTGGTRVSVPFTDTNNYKIYTYEYPATSASNVLINYNSIGSTTAGGTGTTTYFSFFGSDNSGALTTPMSVLWLRTRAYPPNGVMPSVSFGAVQQAPVTLSISPNPATYGQSITITATCPASTDTCAIDYPSLGTAIATGTGSATYTYNPFSLGAGTYSSFYANDITAGTTSVAQTLTVNKNSTYTFTLTSCGAQVYPYSCNTIGTIATHNSQLSASLYLNSNLLGTTTTSISNLQNGTIGYYGYTFNTLGNANYTANSLTANFLSYVPINIYYANTISSEIHKTLNTSGLYLIPACTNNAASLSLGYCIGNMVYSASTTLSGNVYVFGNITIDSGVTLTENGFYMYATGTFDNLGTITGGNNPNAPGGTPNGGVGTSITTSYAGSGGGGGALSGAAAGGGGGGSTLVSGGYGASALTSGANNGGAGSTPSAPTMSQALANNMFNNITKYLSSASGGAGGSGGNGGGGVFGAVIGGNKVIAGTINTNGNAGSTGGNTGGGGGGGGAIFILYNSNYTAGAYSDTGGVGGSSSGSGGNGGNGQVITYSSTFLSSLPITYYYPLKYNATTTSNTINFNVSIFKNENGLTNYQSSNQSFSYLPSQANDYLLSFKEQQGSAKVYLNTSFSLNMTDINSAFTFNSYNDGCIQYFPCLAETPTWTAKPTSWSIIPANELVINQQSNTSNGEQFDSPNLAVSFANAIKLNYPFTSFYLNLTNNPKVQNSITQGKFYYVAFNALNAGMRNIANISIYDQETFNSLQANITFKLPTTFNNYQFVMNVGNNTGSKYFLEIPKSNYINPAITFQLNGTISRPLFFAPSQLFCPTTVPSGSTSSYSIGLVDTNGTKYSFYIYTSAGTSAQNYILFINELKGTGPISAESLIIPPSLPMAVPLEQTGQEYQYIIYNPSCTTSYFKGSFVDPTNPTYITLTSGASQAVIYNKTNVTGACSLNEVPHPWKLVCAASDPSSLTYEYVLLVDNSTNILGNMKQVLYKTFNTSAFSYNTTLPINGSYSYALYAYSYKNADPNQLVNGGPLSQYKINFSAPLLGFFAFLMMLTLLLVGLQTGKYVILLFLVDIGMFVISLIQLVQIPTLVAVVFAFISAIVMYWTIKQR